MSITGRYKVAISSTGTAEMVIRADFINLLPDGVLYVVGEGQKRKFSPEMWRSITIENEAVGGEA